jgi:hypothetical protein
VLWKSSPATCHACARKQATTEAIERSKGEHNHKGLTASEDGKPAKAFKYQTTEIKKVSTRQQKLNAAYSAQRKVFLKNHPFCGIGHFGCSHKAVEIHHKRGHGEFFLDESTWIQVCRSCHSFAEINPVWAKENGFSESRLSKAI